MDYVLEFVVDENADCMRDILRYFTLNPPSKKYSVENKLRQFSHGLILKVFKVLLDRGYIEEVSSKPFKTGKQTVIYGITFDGLSAIYDKLDRDKWNARVDKIGIPVFVYNHSSLLPLIFGKWSHFEEKRVERIAKEQLDKVFSSYLALDEVYEAFFLTKPKADAENANRWIEALRDDPDIRSYAIEKLRSRMNDLYEKKNELESMLQGFLTS